VQTQNFLFTQSAIPYKFLKKILVLQKI